MFKPFRPGDSSDDANKETALVHRHRLPPLLDPHQLHQLAQWLPSPSQHVCFSQFGYAKFYFLWEIFSSNDPIDKFKGLWEFCPFLDWPHTPFSKDQICAAKNIIASCYCRSLLSLLETEWFYLAFTFCHCSAMVCPGNYTISELSVFFSQEKTFSSVINPVIYGFFNENFKREFLLLKDMVRELVFRCVSKKW